MQDSNEGCRFLSGGLNCYPHTSYVLQPKRRLTIRAARFEIQLRQIEMVGNGSEVPLWYRAMEGWL